ncbi:MAG: ROK family protein [Spirochaetia bacterium]|jgi:glucokinase|nr:ROK family protein [Spirochaetia bacterium]
MHVPSNLLKTTILAVDVGGTNISCAIIDTKDGAFLKRFERRYSTRVEPSLVAPLQRFLSEATIAGANSPTLLCVSAAGPVDGHSIKLTNAPWGIDGDELEARFGIRAFVINDFSAIAWGVLLLDHDNKDELVQLASPDGRMTLPTANGPVVVIGAGTGLGFGFALRDQDGIRVYPSEGGHVCLPVYDDESRAFSRWLEDRYGFAAGAEAGVSGQGIGHIFSFLAAKEEALTALARTIMGVEEHERPELVSRAADSGEPLCLRTMDMFVRLYARVAADAATTFLPSSGIYLAGGVAAKNVARFTEGNRFMESFLWGYREHVRAIAANTPVYIVKDYAISLYGAANAAINLASR